MQIPQSGPIHVPNPSDTRLHFESYQNMAKMLNQMRGMTVGTTREVTNNIVHVKLSSVVTDQISGNEVTWDYAADDWVTMDGGREFDGAEFPYLLPANGNWLPSVDDVVVVYEVIDNTDAESRWTFYPLAKLNNSFVPSIDETDNTLLRIQTGTVYLNEEDDGTDVTDDGGFTLSSDAYLVVKWTMPLSDGTAAQTPTVTTTIQTESVEPDFISIGATEVTFKWVIGQLLSSEYTSWWWGDIHHDFPCTPKYHTDVQGGDAQTVDLAAISAATDVDGTVNFLELRKIGHKFAFGNIQDIKDDGTSESEYKFGGISEDIDYDTVDYDDSELNKIKITTKNVTAETVAGLVQSWSESDNSEELIEFLGNWILKEPSGNVKHNRDFITSTSDPLHWKKITLTITGGVQIDDGTAIDEVDIYIDKAGHIWKVNDSTQPTPDENYRYTPCPGVSGSDIIMSATQGTIVELDNKCYSSAGTTEAALTSPVPSVGSVFTTCASCTASQTTEVWRDCPEPGSIQYFMTENTTDNPAVWGCVGSTLIKMYNTNSMTSTSVNVTSVIEQCGQGTSSIPTVEDCTDLVGWPGSDDFGGTGCNSGELNDANYDIRWTETKVGSPVYSITGGVLDVDIPDPNAGLPVSDGFTGTGTDSGSIGDATWNKRWTKVIQTGDVASDSITGNNLVATINPIATGGSQVIRYDINLSPDHTGDFYFEMPLTVANVNNPGGPTTYLRLDVGGTFHMIGYEQSSAASGWFYRIGGSYTTFDTSLNGTKTLIIQRVGSTITFKDGGSTLTTTTKTGDLDLIHILVANNGGGTQITQDVTFTYDYLTALDGVDGDPIEISQGTPTKSSIKFANNIPAQSGDFYTEVDITVDSVTGTGIGPGMFLGIDASTAVGYFQNTAISGWGYVWGGASYTLVAAGIGSKTVAIGRTGSTVKIYIDGIVEYTGTLTGAKTPYLNATNSNTVPAGEDGISGSFDDFIVEDSESLGDDIYIDPSGNSC